MLSANGPELKEFRVKVEPHSRWASTKGTIRVMTHEELEMLRSGDPHFQFEQDGDIKKWEEKGDEKGNQRGKLTYFIFPARTEVEAFHKLKRLYLPKMDKKLLGQGYLRQAQYNDPVKLDMKMPPSPSEAQELDHNGERRQMERRRGERRFPVDHREMVKQYVKEALAELVGVKR